jgi:hypothetical protein
MLKSLMRRWQRPAIETVQALGGFLDERAAFLAQKSVIGYCHAKTSLPLSELIIEKQFADAFEFARLEAYVAILADLIVITEGYLRPAASGRLELLADRLSDLHAELLAAHAAPPHRPQGWADDVAAARRRLAEAQCSAPRSLAEVAKTSAERVFATLPIHERLREPDKPAVIASVRFMMVGLASEFEKRLDRSALIADLLAAPRPPA